MNDELEVGRVEHQALLQEPFEHGAPNHNPGAPDQNVPPHQAPKNLLPPKVEQDAHEADRVGKPDEGGRTPQRSHALPGPASQQHPPEIEQGTIH